MMSKYGYVSDFNYAIYQKSVIGRIYAILPMKEENVPTVKEYIEALNRELVEHIEVFNKSERILAVVCILNGIKYEQNHSIYRKEVLRCCKIISEIGGEENVGL